MKNKIIVLKGAIQTGKTTFLSGFCKQERQVAGILTPLINGKRVFYDIAGDIYFDMEATNGEERFIIGKYEFSASAFARAIFILQQASANVAVDYLIIDEIGPLEIRFLQGFYQSLKEILLQNFNFTLLLVVRQPLLTELIEVFDLHQPRIMDVQEMKDQFFPGPGNTSL
jgi:nucleoside-triphosphatase